jgi:serine/threonine protein kinase
LLFPDARSSCDRKLTAIEDLDVQITQVFEGQGARIRGTATSHLRVSGKSRDRGSPLHSRNDEPRFMGRYALIRRLGQGGMGIVYETRDATDEPIALKMLERPSIRAAEALQREVRALKHLHHPGVVRLREETMRPSDPFFTMDLLPGPSLATIISRGSSNLVSILRSIASSLAFVHARGIVHGDLTPSNILFRTPAEPVLLDFGLSVLLSDAAPCGGRDARGRIIGTLAYMAPERIRRQPVDARADLYAFGCILYEALTGRVPFNGNHRATVMRQHLEAAPCPPSLLSRNVPAELERLCLKLLAKTARERTQSAAEIVAVLDTIRTP